MQLNQFKFLIAVDRYGSISKAAQELYISQSTISLSLINLEEELGYVLLNRSKRGVTFTPEGKEVLKRAYELQNVLDSLKDITGSSEEIIGEVRIASNSHLGMNIITDTMLQLKHQYEGIRIYAQRDDVKEVLKKVAQNELDMGFITYHSLAALDVQNDLKRLQLEFHKTYFDKQAVCTRKDHPLTKLSEIYFEDVARYERVTMVTKKDPFLSQNFRVKDKDISIVTLVDVLNLRKYATQTDAVVILPKNEALRSNEMFPYKLTVLDVKDFDVDIVGGWVHHSTHEMNAAEKCVAQAIENICQSYSEMTL
ncbi:MAG: LysR family transcriptional regulator [Peptococcaceae bacterium]|nr:LysR family transcriptional regulator [Peptococcaceae bacterium]